MEWKTKRVLVTVKAYPEKSTKYGETVCVAGITEENELIRLYPVQFKYFRGNEPIKKYYWIEVECTKNTGEKLQRKESYKIRESTGIKIIDTSFSEPRADWKKRNRIIKPLISDSIEALERKFKGDKTSLGIIKVHNLIEFYSRKPVSEIDMEESQVLQSSLNGSANTLLQRMPHIFAYKFNCSPECPKIHDMNIEDWEVFEFFRSNFKFYNENYDTLWDKMKDKFETYMKTRDLYFYVGTDSQWGKWMIIGLYYPPKVTDLLNF